MSTSLPSAITSSSSKLSPNDANRNSASKPGNPQVCRIVVTPEKNESSMNSSNADSGISNKMKNLNGVHIANDRKLSLLLKGKVVDLGFSSKSNDGKAKNRKKTLLVSTF